MATIESAAATGNAARPIIEVRHLRKEYGETVALENLFLSIPAGEVFGLIGPNGAGKTTLLRILATLLEPTYGEVRIDGIDALAAPLEVHPRMGYMSDFFSLYETMLVWEYLDHFAGCYGISHRQRDGLIGEVLELVGLEVRRDTLVSSLSRGMRQRLCFARALVHQPQVLLLDEPASGLDPAARLEFRALVRKLRELGRTLVISSHILTEMTEFCTSIGIVEQGRIVASGRVDDLLRQLKSALRLRIEVAGRAQQLAGLLSECEQVDNLEQAEMIYTCSWLGERDELPELHRRIVAAGVPIVSFAVEEDDLEDIYMKLSQHQVS